MSVFISRSALALVLAALCLAGRIACAQTVTYSSWPIGFHSNLTAGQGSDIFGSLAGFDGGDARGGLGRHPHHGAGAGPARGLVLLANINHAGVTGGVQVSQGSVHCR